MKKILISIFTLGTLALSAQDGMGFSKGDIALTSGLSYGSNSALGDTIKTTTFSISPEVMFMNTANWGFRGGFSYNSTSRDTVSSSTFGLGAGARYFFTPANRLSFYLDGGVSANFPKNETNVAFNFNPGVNYFIHKNWAFGANFNLASLTFNSPSGESSNINFNVNPVTTLGAINFTLMYVFQK